MTTGHALHVAAIVALLLALGLLLRRALAGVTVRSEWLRDIALLLAVAVVFVYVAKQPPSPAETLGMDAGNPPPPAR